MKCATIGDILEANRVIRQAKALCDIALRFPSDCELEDLEIGVFADAAWANRHDGSS